MCLYLRSAPPAVTPPAAPTTPPPSNAYAWYTQARLLEASGDTDAAVDAMHRALLADHGNPTLMAHLANLLCTQNYGPQGAPVLLEIARAELSPTSEGWGVLIEAEARCALATQDVVSAAATLRAALQTWPDHLPWLLLDADVALVQGDTDRAHLRLSQACDLRPSNLLYIQRLAALEISQGRPESAKARLSSAIDPSAPPALWVSLADAHLALLDEQSALQSLFTCMDFHPINPDCQRSLTLLVLARANATPSNEASLSQLIKSLSDHPAVLVDVWRSLREVQPDRAEKLRELILLQQPHLSERLAGGLH